MKKHNKLILISCFLVVSFSINIYSQNIGFLKIGNDFLPNNKYEITSNGKYELSRSGISIGILIPIKIKHIKTFYKAEVTLHKIIDKKFRCQSFYNNYDNLFDKHISGVNEILFGKSLFITEKNTILPQIGLGFQIESLYKDSQRNSVESITYNTVLFDIALSYFYSFDFYHIGIMLNWAQGIKKSTFVYDATDRIGFSLIVGI